MGRRRKSNVARDARGKSRGEPADAVRAVALTARAQRMGDLSAAAGDPMAGSTLGMLCLRWQYARAPEAQARKCPPMWTLYSISPELHDAGIWYAGRVRAHASVMGYSIDKLKSPGFGLVAGGMDCRPEMDKEKAIAIKADFRDAYRLLVDQGMQVAVATYDLCLDRLTMPEAESAIIAIKVGLTALGKMRRGQLTDRRKSRPFGEMRC